jgi:hypothetical protein
MTFRQLFRRWFLLWLIVALLLWMLNGAGMDAIIHLGLAAVLTYVSVFVHLAVRNISKGNDKSE